MGAPARAAGYYILFGGGGGGGRGYLDRRRHSVSPHDDPADASRRPFAPRRRRNRPEDDDVPDPSEQVTAVIAAGVRRGFIRLAALVRRRRHQRQRQRRQRHRRGHHGLPVRLHVLQDNRPVHVPAAGRHTRPHTAGHHRAVSAVIVFRLPQTHPASRTNILERSSLFRQTKKTMSTSRENHQ